MIILRHAIIIPYRKPSFPYAQFIRSSFMIVRLLPPALLLCTFISLASAQTIPLRSSPDPLLRARQGRLLVKVTADQFARGVTPETFGEAMTRFGIRQVQPWLNPRLVTFRLPAYKRNGAGTYEMPALALRRIMLVEYSSEDAPEVVAEALERSSGVEYAEPIYPRRLLYTPNDPELFKQWYLDSIHAAEAWDVVRGDGSITIAIVDCGIERTHPDLRDAIWYNPGETGLDDMNRDRSTNGVDDDGNGFVDDWWGYDFAGPDAETPDNDPSPGEENHGTIVAGIAGATGDNGTGIAGVAFGVKLMAVKVLDDESFDSAEFAREMEGVLYAAKMGAKVINCSWGGRASYRSEQEVLDVVTHDYDAVVVSAAGNDGLDVRYYPASYDGVLSVASTNQINARANFSNYNYRIDIAAPGSDIYSTFFESQGSYGYDPGGTSFSAPMVSGAAALVRLRHPELDAEQVREVLRAATDDIRAMLGPFYADKMGTGRLNARRAVELGATQISARMISHEFIGANDDGVISAGENVRLRVDVRNILAGAGNVTVTVTPLSHPDLTIQIPTTDLGAMAAHETRSTPDGTILFMVPPGTPDNTEVAFSVEVTADGRTNRDMIQLRVSPTFLTTDLNNIAATFNSVGNIGYNGFRSSAAYHGDGFVFDRGDYLFHGGLIIATDSVHVADVIRRGPANEGLEDGFRTIIPYRLETAQDSSIQTGTARFGDNHLPQERRVGVTVDMTTYEYRTAPNTVIVSYRLTNTTTEEIAGARVGLYLDWDVGSSGFQDQVGYDPDNRLGYARAAYEPDRGYVGAAVLTPYDASFYAVDNDADNAVTFFTAARKWQMLSSGIRENSAITDMAMMIGTGPITIPPGQEVTVAFALMGAHDFQQLRDEAAQARQLFAPGSVGGEASAGTLASAATPNPFGDGTVLNFTMPAGGHARLAVYDIHGREVVTLFDGHLRVGAQRIPFNAEGLPDGIYIYEIRAGGIMERGKIIRQGG